MSYIGAIQIGATGDEVAIGSTLFGTCDDEANDASKEVTLNNFDAFVGGIAICVKFSKGNTVLNNVTLKVGSTNMLPVTGNCICSPNDVIVFTYDRGDGQNLNDDVWRAHQNIKIETNNNIITKIAGQEVNLATKTYVDNATGGLSGLTGAMHFKGSVNSLPEETAQETFSTYDAGDVVLGPNHKEYVYNKGVNAASSKWVELGDEGSYMLNSAYTTTSIGTASNWNAGDVPTLGEAISADEITKWEPGTASTATVNNGVLHLGNSTLPVLSHTTRTIPNVTSVGTAPSLSTGTAIVVIPATT